MNDSKKMLLLNVIKIVLAVVGLILVFATIYALGGMGVFKDMTLDEKNTVLNNTNLGLMTTFVILIVLIGAALIVGFFVFSLALDPKKALKSVAGYLLATVAFFVFYLIAKGTMIQAAYDKGIEQSTVKATEAGIYLTIAMVVVGFVLMLFGGLFKYIKK
jgi:hypothetical protein